MLSSHQYWLLHSFILLLITACTPMYHTQFDFVPPQSERGQSCVQQCKRSEVECKKYCIVESQSLCEARAKQEARRKYQLYVHEMKEQHKLIVRTEASFFDPSYCRFGNRETHGCNCEADFRACYQLCGGQIIAKQQCVANCH